MKLETGRVVAGRYKIDEQLGMGGMAVVYRAKDLRLDRYVTLKVLRDEYTADEEFIGRFDIEARAAASLQHPNIVSIYDSGQDGDIYYIVFEYVNGSTLKELITRKAPFDNKTTLGVAIQIASGLSDAHGHNIIHRDIKPQNILVTTDHSVKITDFGIARAAKSATLDGSKDMMGSAHYFSPEQARGGYIDPKSDIYSLGIVMFEMAAGRVPFEDESVVAIALKHINENLPNINEFNPEISESIIKIIKRATEKSTSRRYATVEEMADDLKRALTDASGDFVEEPKDYKDSPTKNITSTDLAEIKRARLSKKDYEDDYGGDEEYEDDDYEEDDYEYEDEEEYEDEVEYTRERKSVKKRERITILAAVLAALVFIFFIAWGMWSYYQGQKPKEVSPVDLTGMTLEQANTEASAIGLTVVSEEGYDDDVPAGFIFYQAETQDTKLKEGDAIHVTVSLGPETFEMPSVFEKSIEDARALFEDMDVEVKEIPIESDEYPAGIVAEQNPQADAEINAGDIVTLTVSTGPDTSLVYVPLLLDLTEAEAIALLEENDLIPGLSEKAESTTYLSGIICDQTLEPGEQVERGTVVSYTVSIGGPVPTPEPEREPEPTPVPEETAEPADGGEVVTAPEVTGRNLTIYLWGVDEGVQTVPVIVYKIEGSNQPEQIFREDARPVTSFPFDLPVYGTGVAEFRIHTVVDGTEVPVATQQIAFDALP